MNFLKKIYLFLGLCAFFNDMSVGAMEPLEEKDEKKNMRVLIVGFGIAGKAMAHVFCQAGIFPDVVEKCKEEDIREGTGLALPANAVWALNRLGFRDVLEKKACIIEEMSFSKPDGEILTTRSVADIHKEGVPFMALHRKSLADLLSAPLKDLSVCYGTTVIGLKEQDE